MKLVIICIFLLLCTSLIFGQTARRVQVAVINFDVSGSYASASRVLTDRFRNELMNTVRFDVMERSKMDEILNEQGFQQTGACNNDACVVQAGKILGVSKMIAGSVGQVGSMFTASARLLSVETGQILISVTEDCYCQVEVVLTQSMRNLANKLSKASIGLDVEYSFIVGGTFNMGGSAVEDDLANMPKKVVAINDFYLGKTEVTVAQYRAFCIATNHPMPATPAWGWQDNHPIVNVNWNDAVTFCKWAGGRLPTEAEWEYAARERGKKLLFGNGKNVADPAEINFNATLQYLDPSTRGDIIYRGKTTPVGTFPPNNLSLYDMSGNASEWCQDWIEDNFVRNSPDDHGLASGWYRATRGGSWFNQDWFCNTWCQIIANPDATYSNDGNGFRIARSAQ